ncbi:MAG: glycosyltransferase family 4 protein, partial [Deltaproteobacteria bacterium]|nr:glycosyltransferase family 4 protein [Deltaproteobacteria bacterium]
MLKAAFVIPWYGQDIPGGAEAECRRTAENLAVRGVEVEVLTTCLHSQAASWDKNFHRPGETMEAGVAVRRFPIEARNGPLFDDLNLRLMEGRSLTPWQQKAFLANMVNSRALYQHVAKSRDCLFLPLPYLFSTTWQTARLAPERTVPIACLHDEGYAYLDPIRRAFLGCRAVIFHTRSELELARDIWGLNRDQALLLGEGVDTDIVGDSPRFRAKYGLDEPFILYAGRRDPTKNTPLLLDFFARYKQAKANSRLKLVLIGSQPFEKPPSLTEEVVDLAFLNPQDKADAFAAADIFCQPSIHESFSLVIMEAWLNSTPVLVHGRCPATREHVERSGGGQLFNDIDDFIRAVDRLLDDKASAKRMAQAGREYVLANFNWDLICERYMNLLAQAESWTRWPSIKTERKPT